MDPEERRDYETRKESVIDDQTTGREVVVDASQSDVEVAPDSVSPVASSTPYAGQTETNRDQAETVQRQNAATTPIRDTATAPARDNADTQSQNETDVREQGTTGAQHQDAVDRQKQDKTDTQKQDKADVRKHIAGSWKTPETAILWIAWVFMVGFNGFVEIFKFNGTSTGQIAHEANVWFMPAGYAFAIWGLIYIGLAVWLVRFCVAGPSRKRLGTLPISLSGIIFVLTCALNIAWLTFWHLRSFTISLIVIAALTVLVWALYALVRRDQHKDQTPSDTGLLDWVPISLYGSWLTAATVLNAVYDIEVLSGGIADVIQMFGVVIALGLLFVLAYFMNQRASDFVCCLVLLWVGIAVGVQLLQRNTAASVLVIALTAIGGFVVLFPWKKFKLVRK